MKKTICSVVFLMLVSLRLTGQADSTIILIPGQDTIFQHLPEGNRPVFPGGQDALYALIQHVKYPADARASSKQGAVIIGLIIEKDGSVNEPFFVQKVYPSLDTEALRVAMMIPDGWTPANFNGRPVRYQYQLPVRFTLQSKSSTLPPTTRKKK